MSTDNVQVNREESKTVYLELSDGKSHKFYEVIIADTEVSIRYGRIGTPGQFSCTTYPTSEIAQSEATKKINEKLKKGYVQLSIDPPIKEAATDLAAGINRPPVGHVFTLTTGLAGGRNYLGFLLQRSLAVVEIVATCDPEIIGLSSFPAFTINLDAGTDIAYHFDVRVNQGQIVQNTCVAGGWGSEDWLAMPTEFATKLPFTLRITVDQDIVVDLNDRILGRYDHRLPPTQISAVHLVYVPGGLQVQAVKVFEPATRKALTPEPLISQVEEVHVPRSQPEQLLSTLQPNPTAQELTTTVTSDIPQFLQDLPSQFAPLRSLLEANLIPYIQIKAGEKVGDFTRPDSSDPLPLWQSKIGGNPYFPKQAEYPTDDTGKAMSLLMQVNCVDVPPIAGFDFPQHGILQFYLGGSEPADAYCNEQYRVLYFPEIEQDESQLITDFSFIEEIGLRYHYGEIYPIQFAIGQDVFWESRYFEEISIPEEFTELCEEFDEWLNEYLIETETRIRGPKLGGYVDCHSDTDEIAERANGRLLLELIHPFHSDDSFLFFIPDVQLSQQDFSEVEFYHVCD